MAILESVRIPAMELTILAGSTAKIPFHGIPGIDRIPLDSTGFRPEYVGDCKELTQQQIEFTQGV